MPLHEMINRLVPVAPIRPHARAVPPVSIEFAVSEHHDLSQRIQQRLEDRKETGQPDNERYR